MKKVKAVRKSNFVTNLAEEIINKLKPFCKRIHIAGSVRRKEKSSHDIDIVLIPKNKEKIEEFLREKGKYLQGGEQKSTFKIKGVKVELYYTIPDEWGATLLAYSSKKGAAIGLRFIAKKKGFRLSQHGLFKNHKFVAGKSEKEIYKKLGRYWKPAEKR